MSNNLRKNNAITLVALIITIIILLILAGISIQIISQNNSIKRLNNTKTTASSLNLTTCL